MDYDLRELPAGGFRAATGLFRLLNPARLYSLNVVLSTCGACEAGIPGDEAEKRSKKLPKNR